MDICKTTPSLIVINEGKLKKIIINDLSHDNLSELIRKTQKKNYIKQNNRDEDPKIRTI